MARLTPRLTEVAMKYSMAMTKRWLGDDAYTAWYTVGPAVTKTRRLLEKSMKTTKDRADTPHRTRGKKS